MIEVKDKVFHLYGEDYSYIFRVTGFGHLENLHYGAPATDADIPALTEKKYLELGNQVIYDSSDRTYCLDDISLECGTLGRGDFRHPSIEVKMPDGSFVCDFVYQSHSVQDGGVDLQGLVSADGAEQSLVVQLKDKLFDVFLTLIYSVYESGVITRSCYIKNMSSGSVCVKKLMSMQLDLPFDDLTYHTLDGSWIKERYKTATKIGRGVYVNEAITGNSSSRHNPFFMLSRGEATEMQGECYGFNLVYSGNHYSAVDISPAGKTRVMTGINPHCFELALKEGESFYTPQAVLCYSGKGFNGLSDSMHSFVKKNITPKNFRSCARPVLFNNWEGTYFDFTMPRLKRLARVAASLGAELFVLDDGWFGRRNDDHSSLGDWTVNTKKLRGGLSAISDYVHRRGMKFGLWFEPEMVNRNSDLFRAHSDYALQVAGRTPCEGRNQLVLDLCRQDVQDYIVKSLTDILSSTRIEYVKWDMNRNITDAFSSTGGGAVFHRYILGLYSVLGRITSAFPDVLFESCASGGGRFDLGMLRFTPQIWTSDNTDAYARLSIQGGTSYGYPQCTMGAHVASSPSHQTLRRVPLETRFNVAAFGLLGYELDLAMLTRVEKKAIRAQIEFYKAHRHTLQNGRLARLVYKDKTVLMAYEQDASKAVIGVFEGAVSPAEPTQYLPAAYLNEDKSYNISVREQSISLSALGGLINFVSPVKLRGDGILQTILSANFDILKSDHFSLQGVSGALINRGAVKLNQRFVGTGYNPDMRLLADFDSRLYVLEQCSP